MNTKIQYLRSLHVSESHKTSYINVIIQFFIDSSIAFKYKYYGSMVIVLVKYLLITTPIPDVYACILQYCQICVFTAIKNHADKYYWSNRTALKIKSNSTMFKLLINYQGSEKRVGCETQVLMLFRCSVKKWSWCFPKHHISTSVLVSPALLSVPPRRCTSSFLLPSQFQLRQRRTNPPGTDTLGSSSM